MTTKQQAQLAVRLSPAERRAIKRAAVDLDVSVSALARRALLDYLQRIASDPVARPQRKLGRDAGAAS